MSIDANISIFDSADFLPASNPRVEEHYRQEHMTVYVPSLVYLLHRLGGPDNINDLSDEDGKTELRAWNNEIIVKASLARHDDGRPSELVLSHWARADRHMTVIFGLPERWHLGEWTVKSVHSLDRFSTTHDLDRAMAEECNRFIGMSLADSPKPSYVA